eukprot:19450-Heterococcus_DN1.PRE.1
MVRTVFSPRCWATSSTRRGSPLETCTSRALRIGGSFLSNCTSTTAPMTWVILPRLVSPFAAALPLAAVVEKAAHDCRPTRP